MGGLLGWFVVAAGFFIYIFIHTLLDDGVLFFFAVVFCVGGW